MPQDSLALNNLTVGEALYFTAHLRGLYRTSARHECKKLLELWQMGSPQRRKQVWGNLRKLNHEQGTGVSTQIRLV